MKNIAGLLFTAVFSLTLVLVATPGYAQDPADPASSELPAVIDTLPLIDPAAGLSEDADDEDRKKKKVDLSQVNLSNRSKDHLMLQVGYYGWAGVPDTINTRGLSRAFNVYFMFDFPFKSNPHLSIALGAGVSSNNIFFSDTYIDIAGRNNTNRISFNDVSDTTHFKKYKLVTTYLEAPVELRYLHRPDKPKGSFKAAIGAKIGTLLSATTKGKNLQNSSDQTINAFTQKEKSKRFFNSTRLNVTGRVGLGSLSLFGTYQVNAFIREGMGPDVRPYTIGLSLSGL